MRLTQPTHQWPENRACTFKLLVFTILLHTIFHAIKKITKYTKKRENITRSQEKEQTKEAGPEKIQMLESLGKDFKITTKNTLHETVANMDGNRWGIPVEEWKLCFKLYKKLFVKRRNVQNKK